MSSIARRRESATRAAPRPILIDWRSTIVAAARRQKDTPPGAPLWHFLTKPASVVCTKHGELALELGDPPLLLISSDAEMLPRLQLELEVMRYSSQSCRMTDEQRKCQAQLYTAGAYLADALEQLSGGLRDHFAAGGRIKRYVSDVGPMSIVRCPRGSARARSSLDRDAVSKSDEGDSEVAGTQPIAAPEPSQAVDFPIAGRNAHKRRVVASRILPRCRVTP